MLIISQTRDLIQWGVFPISHSDIPVDSVPPEEQTLRDRLNIAINSFCTSLNCCEPYCAAHGLSLSHRGVELSLLTIAMHFSEQPWHRIPAYCIVRTTNAFRY